MYKKVEFEVAKTTTETVEREFLFPLYRNNDADHGDFHIRLEADGTETTIYVAHNGRNFEIDRAKVNIPGWVAEHYGSITGPKDFDAALAALEAFVGRAKEATLN